MTPLAIVPTPAMGQSPSKVPTPAEVPITAEVPTPATVPTKVSAPVKVPTKVPAPAKAPTKVPTKVPAPDKVEAKKRITDEYKHLSIVLEKDNYVSGDNLTNFVKNFVLLQRDDLINQLKEEFVDFCQQPITDTKNKRPESNDNTALSLQLYLVSLSKREVVEVSENASASSESVVGRRRGREEEPVTTFTISDENLDTLLREEDVQLYDIQFRRKALLHEKDRRLNLAKKLFHEKIIEELSTRPRNV